MLYYYGHWGLLSIIIPTLNEERGVGKTIESIPLRQLSEMGFRLEILVIDGNSEDETRQIAKRHGAKVIILLINRSLEQTTNQILSHHKKMLLNQNA